jgi:death-on-curing protein
MLVAKFVEHLHDELVTTLWPGTMPVNAGEYRDRGMIESAVSRPFHSAFGQEAYPTLTEKAAALFHSLVCNHPFCDGNKRTAVLAVNFFLIANGQLLRLSNESMYELACGTAGYKVRGLSNEESISEIVAALRPAIIAFAEIRKAAKTSPEVRRLYPPLDSLRRTLRRNRHNRLLPSTT